MYLGRVICTNFFLLLLLVHPSLLRCGAKKLHNCECDKPSSCGQILNISHPFGLKGAHPKKNCRKPIYQLECENNNTIFYLNNAVKHYVLEINYQNSTIRVVDASLQKDNCSTLPFRSFTPSSNNSYIYPKKSKSVLYLSCENPVDSSLYIETGPCMVKRQYYSYVLLGHAVMGDVADLCRIDMVVKSSSPAIYSENLSYADIHNELLHGFELQYWADPPHEAICFLCIIEFIIFSLPVYVVQLFGMTSDPIERFEIKEVRAKMDGRVESNMEEVNQKESTMDWRNLFAASVDQALEYFPLQQTYRRITVKPLYDAFEECIYQWQSALVAQFIGMMPNFSLFQKMVNVLLGKNSLIEIKLAGINLFVIQFPNEEVRDWVIEHRPWHIQNKPLIIQKWEPGMRSLECNMEMLPIWVHLGNIPLELYTKKGLSYIASALDNPLYMDSITANK